jgi:hypothetical protein
LNSLGKNHKKAESARQKPEKTRKKQNPLSGKMKKIDDNYINQAERLIRDIQMKTMGVSKNM